MSKLIPDPFDWYNCTSTKQSVVFVRRFEILEVAAELGIVYCTCQIILRVR
jgi:hypothetical protein